MSGGFGQSGSFNNDDSGPSSGLGQAGSFSGGGFSAPGGAGSGFGSAGDATGGGFSAPGGDDWCMEASAASCS